MNPGPRERRATKRTVRIGLGSYKDPEGELERNHSRSIFLSAVARVKPQVLDDLSRDSLPAYRSALSKIGRSEMPSWSEFGWIDEIFDDEGVRVLEDLRSSLHRWAKRWNLGETWCFEIALLTLDNWAHDPEALERRSWAQPAVAYFQPIEASTKTFKFDHPGWDPISERRADARRSLTAAFQLALESYLDSIENQANAQELATTTEKNTARVFDHFIWLARMQIDEVSAGSIARELRLGSRRTVEQAVNDVAEMIGLTRFKRSN